DLDVTVENQTDAWMSLIIAGPNSRKVLEKITTADVSNDAFKWLTSQTISIGRISNVHAMRVNYVGELGWELHVPTEYAAGLYEILMEAGAEFNISDFGMYAMDSMRLEKGYRAWKSDINHEYTPFMSNLDRFVDMNKGDFVGKEALAKQLDAGVPERLVPLTMDDIGADAPYCASVFQNGEQVGLVVSAGYGHVLEQSIGLAYIRTDLAVEGQEFEVDIFGDMVKATVGHEPLYDHNNAKLRS
ncbi:MAG: aminomethyltransferase family protein, partial [Alphaproteobacteria bacterium]